jgi:hypothetical protein
VRVRATIPAVLTATTEGFEPSDPYVRRFWVAAIGPSAVAELLRVIRAAERGEDVRLPRSLPMLLRAGLAQVLDGRLVVQARLPEVPLELRWRFTPALSAEHGRWMARIGREAGRD